MLEWLATAAGSIIIGSSTPAILQRLKEKAMNRHGAAITLKHMSADIACVASAVAAREASLSAGAKTHGDAVANAYSARATALASAYAATSTPAIRRGVNVVWEAFNTAIRTARKNWQRVRDAAWAQFRTAAKSCKTSIDVLEAANASSEPRGE